MGLMDQIGGSVSSTKRASSLRMQHTPEEVEAHGKALMDSIEQNGPPNGVILIHENNYQQGGRDFTAIFWMVVGGMFFFVPLGIFLMIFGGLMGGGEIVGIGWICIPLMFLLLIPAGRLGWGIMSGSAQVLFMPEPIEHVVRKVWYDPNHRYLAVLKHLTDEETGVEYYPEFAHGVFVETTDVVSVQVTEPSDGAVTFGSRTVVLLDPTEDPWAPSLCSFQRFEYGEHQASDELGRTIARTMNLNFNS